jgi:peptide/nickel transport system substrate-binding protein
MSSRRLFLRALTACILIAIAACGTSSSPKEGTRTTGSPVTDEALTTAKSDTGGTTTTGARGVPNGRVVYGWHLTIPPVWLDPQEAQNVITPYGIMYALHDSMIKHYPGKQLQPGLAESYKIADDFRSATFKIREAARFQNGEPVTSEDVKFTYENYRGTQAKVFKDKTERIETPDTRTITFYFKEPFLDFLYLYGTPATGIGWIVPKKYYQQVGPDGYKQKPIGAGPYKLVRNTSFTELEFEAMPDYWRKSPHVKTVVFKVMTDDATRFAALQTGEVDFTNVIPGALLEAAKKNPQITLAQVATAPWWLEFSGWDRPNSPFHDVRVRRAVSLAINRKAINDAETGGFSRIDEGNWIPGNLAGALEKKDIKPDWYAYDLPKAKQLMAEAGFPNGFEVEQLTPLAPYYPLAERVITQLAEIGIRTKLNKMERATMVDLLTKGVDGLPGIILYVSGLNGDAAARVRAFAICGGTSSRTCLPEADAKFAQYEKSTDPAERDRLIKEIQKIYNDLYLFPYVYNIGLTMAQGARIANDWHEIWFAVPQYPYIYPWEDVRLKS